MIGVYDYTVILTYMSAILAGVGMMLACYGQFIPAVLMLILCGICDLFDGIVARTKKDRTDMEKAFGIQIDSFCDLISFGVFPAVLGYTMTPGFSWEKIVFFLFPLAGVIRLAYYNITEEVRQKETDEKRKFYVGLPITSSAVVIPALFLLQPLFAPEVFYIIFTVGLGITGILFISKIRVFKPGIKGAVFFVIIGIVAVVRLIMAS